MTAEFKIIILASFDRHNFPNKAMADIHGKPMIQRVFDSAKSSSAAEIVIATDSPRVGMAAEDFGATVCMVVDDKVRGIARMAEVVDKMGWGDDTVVVNFPGDAPLTPGELLDQVATELQARPETDAATLYSVLPAESIGKRHCTTLVTDHDSKVLYMSRQPLPQLASPDYKPGGYKCYLGLNAYRAGLLRIFRNLPVGDIELAEDIEELRLVYNGLGIHAAEASCRTGQRVLSEDDLEKVKIQFAPAR